MKPVDVKSSTYIDSGKKIIIIIIKILNLKLVILLEYQNIKIFLEKVTLQIGLKRFLWLKRLKILCHGHTVISDLTEEEILGLFYKNKLQNKNQKEFRNEKTIKRKRDKFYVKWKGYNDLFNSWIYKKDIV